MSSKPSEPLPEGQVRLRKVQRSRALLKLGIEHPEVLMATGDATAVQKVDIVVALAHDYADALWAQRKDKSDV